ncbi:hypothetical protein EVAR_86576_1 [Eumeta japonica]|uniref:Uncharacterized protein n=1 Tax=Eumeta variegata TaxID=151549 RepID=A0A4C1W2J0_EUMVA|nr:hypothetical protein EVAR_86576_1 [Eumeta japonica]
MCVATRRANDAGSKSACGRSERQDSSNVATDRSSFFKRRRRRSLNPARSRPMWRTYQTSFALCGGPLPFFLLLLRRPLLPPCRRRRRRPVRSGPDLKLCPRSEAVPSGQLYYILTSIPGQSRAPLPGARERLPSAFDGPTVVRVADVYFT